MDLPHEKAAIGSLDRPALLALVEPVLHAQGCSLVEISFKTERPGWVLRVAIEREGSTHPGGGVTVDLCADVSRELSATLDATELIPQAYHLEVASPGVERTLRSTEELARFAGQLVKVMLREPAEDGQRVLRGTLVSVEGDAFSLNVDGNTILCPVANVKQANLQLEFGSAHKSSGKRPASTAHPKRSASGEQPSKQPSKSTGKAGLSNKAPHPKSAPKGKDAASSPSSPGPDGESQGRGISAETE
jgi:ribosome maturation factor RimP